MASANVGSTTDRLSRRRVFGYSLGDVANNVSFQMTSLFLMAYMTDIAGVPAAIAGTIYGVTKVWAGGHRSACRQHGGPQGDQARPATTMAGVGQPVPRRLPGPAVQHPRRG